MSTTDLRGQPIQHPIGLLLRTLDGLINERFERTLGTRGVSRRQWQLLHTLAERPAMLDVLNAAVAPFLDHTAGETVKQHLDPLAEKGLVTATRDVYELTDSGRRLFDSLIEDVQAIRDLTVRGLTDYDYDRTISSLQTMVDNLVEQA
jgi:DNA-binding MarR family transcriptional regulator